MDYISGKDTTNDDLRASATGSILAGNGGDDVLRGGKGNDILVGGAGDDKLYGGAGADQFRFFGNQIGGVSDVDSIYDLNFGEGDTLVFGQYNGLFSTSSTGLNGFANGDSAIISSYAGLAAAYEASGGRITYTGNANLNLLIISFDNGSGATQTIRITQGYDAFINELSAI